MLNHKEELSSSIKEFSLNMKTGQRQKIEPNYTDCKIVIVDGINPKAISKQCIKIFETVC